jgi:5-(carboxyamino)imidazole ribonucleotide mutase
MSSPFWRFPFTFQWYRPTALRSGCSNLPALPTNAVCGGAAHLPGMVAAITPLPVIGVPVKSSNSIDGWDSILSILQMPEGVPVATVALDAARNAGILAAQILATSDAVLLGRIQAYKQGLQAQVAEKASEKGLW